MSSFENQTFRKAAQDAGITGEDWKGESALDHFSTYYHNTYDKSDRETHGYRGIREIAESWWSYNSHRYGGNTFTQDEDYDNR